MSTVKVFFVVLAMAKLIVAFALVAESFAQSNLTLGTSGTVYFIRHGEKKSAKGCESSKGLKRADNMYSVFKSKFNVPDFVYAWKYGSADECERCEQTAKPIAKKIGMDPQMHHGEHDCQKKWGGCTAIADAIKKKLSDHKYVLFVSEHVHIQYIVHDLGVPKSQIPEWKSSDYDSVYKLKFSGSKVSFSVHKQGQSLEDEEDVLV